ncbi:DUF2513 domain-containing protein [Priestia sp. JV24]|uniref:DUF2513 domain-containing protein n=1 Tax=Priestia TaxID=2800373 RepID=UPI0021D64BC9|nr:MULTISPECIES: DUF2513 domain-containing protein [Priestia]MCU7712980.1 DUF2513 domain-containing protein [Priestia megaterium]MCW1049165.1 DUF2513 domain-containing protein [Priestia sp. JV24]
MKLDQECVRYLLLTIEEEVLFNQYLWIEDLLRFQLLEKYSEEELLYTVLKLKEANFIDAHIESVESGSVITNAYVSQMTWHGHEFLDTIRDPEVWKQTKVAVSKVAGVSLSMLATVAGDLLLKKLNLS